ncbi:DUF4142 domain-containing protein [Pedobacter puniceum]|uniref:DUF4142 domain-containing protein n=1 Tax=Pedobacter puniceum TaxID=2666136 RepID=A0A7K0FMB7_9SPHI|nr:DUF4142 domain-containing protein [Pedobacter puniceum]MRX46972.1 DUF4142 domain-containing protein [Pedobacter puniceum]
MKKSFYLASVLAAGIALQACNNQQSNQDSVDSAEAVNDSTLTSQQDDPAEFLVEAASGGMMEVELGKIAQANANHPRVKSFAQMMVNDHSAANTELMTLAQSKNVTLPQTMGEDHQKMMDDLKNKKGADFDKAYMDMMVDDHKDDVELFEEATTSKDVEISAFAGKILPKLKIHLDSAKAIHDAVKQK